MVTCSCLLQRHRVPALNVFLEGSMREWLEGLAGPEYVMALLWTLGALILLGVVWGVGRVVPNLACGTFVGGAGTRKTGLGVMGATAVDSHRRLVLVRRDD